MNVYFCIRIRRNIISSNRGGKGTRHICVKIYAKEKYLLKKPI